MQLPAIVTSDLHLVAAPSCEYRWRIFPWLVSEARAERARTILILGDVTDAKDNHGAELVNRVVAGVRSLAEVARVVVLAGNHDWLRSGHEFFKFLNALDGVRFVTEPWEDDDVKGESALFLPHSKDPARDWAGLDFGHYRYGFMHQTVGGSRASNGQEMSGEELPDLSGFGKVYSGDIHVPQVVGPVEYVGSPYHVHFGDRFKPRVVLIGKGNRAEDLHMESPHRLAPRLQDLEAVRKLARTLRKGDQVKLTLELDESDSHDWARVKRLAAEEIRAAGATVAGIELSVLKSGQWFRPDRARSAALSPAQEVERFAEAEGLGAEATVAALDIVEDRR